MTNQNESILVCGAVLVGSLLAYSLKKKGLEVTLIERRSDMRLEAGDSGRSINLIITSKGLEAVKKVGLLKEVLALTVPVTGRMMHSRDGELTYQPYGKDPSECNYSISRGELNKLLMTEAEKVGVKIIFEHSLESINVKESEAIFLDSFKKEKKFKFTRFFGTDGANSKTRKQILSLLGDSAHESMELINSDYKEMSMPSTFNGDYPIEKNALHIWPRGSYMLMALPNQDGSFTMTLYLPKSGDKKSFDSINNSDDLEKLFEEDFKDAIPLMPDYQKEYEENPQGVLGTVRTSPWFYEDKICLLGDAAHAIVPFFGQGMNSGFDDVFCLLTLFEEECGNWGKIFNKYGPLQEKNGNAIADMAIENFYEMCDKVGDINFLFRKKVENELQKKFPKKFRSRYGMVVYTLIPYWYAQEAGKIQSSILSEVSRGKTSLEEIDWDLAERLIDEQLVPFQVKNDINLDRYNY